MRGVTTALAITGVFCLPLVAFASSWVPGDVQYQCYSSSAYGAGTFVRFYNHDGESVRFGSSATGTPYVLDGSYPLFDTAAFVFDPTTFNTLNGGQGYKVSSACQAYEFAVQGGAGADFLKYISGATTTNSFLYVFSQSGINWGAQANTQVADRSRRSVPQIVQI